ncbi:hypothetical protein [Candidatus Nitrosocosmicus hydrocola]|uniref:hypothetical protein n=1 Tax=Candidatus Nitrosocosmicus hydrocola TaxID=1826872 RepID=UPI000AFCED91|nr:hypothetical protein [Candidatus Nitrosocosmicus hydrocola]
MHYLNYFTILVLLLPLLLVSTISSPSTLGAEQPSSIITPSNSICCKNETSFSSQAPSSIPVTSPLKKISSNEENSQIRADEANSDSSMSDELSSTPDSSTSTVESPLKKIDTSKNNIITPSNSFSSQAPSSIPVTSPLKKISSNEENSQIRADEANSDSSMSDELSSTPDSSTSTVESPLNRANDENIEDSSYSNPTRVSTQLDNDDSAGSNLSNMVQNNLDKLLYSDFPVDSSSDESSSDESSSDESSSDESSIKLEELQSMMSEVFS